MYSQFDFKTKHLKGFDSLFYFIFQVLFCLQAQYLPAGQAASADLIRRLQACFDKIYSVLLRIRITISFRVVSSRQRQKFDFKILEIKSCEFFNMNKMHQNSEILGDFISELSSKWKLKIHRQISHIETVTFEFQGRELFLRW